MNKKPKVFVLLSLVILAIAASLPVQIMILYEHPFSEFDLVLGKLTWNNWLVMLLGAALAIQVYFVMPNLPWTIPLFCLLIAGNNYLVGFVEIDFSMLETSLASLGLTLIFFPLLSQRSLELIKNPNKRWWLRSPRSMLQMPAQLITRHGALRAYSFDISDTGIYLTLDFKEPVKPDLNESDRIDVLLKLDQLQTFRCQAKLVRMTQGQKGYYPAGIGLKFTNQTSFQKQQIKKHLKSQEQTL